MYDILKKKKNNTPPNIMIQKLTLPLRVTTLISKTTIPFIMTGDKVLDLVHLFLLKKLRCISTVGFCDQASS